MGNKEYGRLLGCLDQRPQTCFIHLYRVKRGVFNWAVELSLRGAVCSLGDGG